MLQDPAVDLVVITTPPATHFHLTQLAMQAGKDVVVEKPFVPSSKEGRELIELARKVGQAAGEDGKGRKLRKGGRVAVYQNRRWDADFVTLAELIKTGKFGRVAEFETHFDRHRPQLPATAKTQAPSSTAAAAAAAPAQSSAGWKNEQLPGGGAIYDLGTHLLDQVVNLFGMPDRVTGFVGSQRRSQQGDANADVVDDSCTILCHYDKEGLLATAKAGVVSPEVEQLRYWVRGEKGGYKKFHLDCQEDQLKEGLRPGEAGFGIEPAEWAGVVTTVDDSGKINQKTWPNKKPPPTYVEFYARLAAALDGTEELPVTTEEAEQVIRLIELARLSSKKGYTLRVGERFEEVDG